MYSNIKNINKQLPISSIFIKIDSVNKSIIIPSKIIEFIRICYEVKNKKIGKLTFEIQSIEITYIIPLLKLLRNVIDFFNFVKIRTPFLNIKGDPIDFHIDESYFHKYEQQLGMFLSSPQRKCNINMETGWTICSYEKIISDLSPDFEEIKRGRLFFINTL